MKHDANGRPALEAEEIAAIQRIVAQAQGLNDEMKLGIKDASDEIRTLKADNARMTRALAAFRRSEAFQISSAFAATVFALLGGGWAIALLGYVDRYGWDGVSAILALMTTLWAVMLSAIVLKAIEK